MNKIEQEVYDALSPAGIMRQDEQEMFCDICGCEILSDDEMGSVTTSQWYSAVNKKRYKSTVVCCVDCAKDYHKLDEVDK